MLIHDDEYELAPSDPLLAFTFLSSLAQQRTEELIIQEYNIYEDSADVRPFWFDLAATLEGITEALEIPIDVDFRPPTDQTRFNEWMFQFKSDLRRTLTKIQLNSARLGKSESDPSLRFGSLDLSDYRSEIRSLTDKIRKIIRQVNIREEIRDKLFDKLNSFEKDLDRDRTRWETFISLFRTTTAAIGEGAEELEPAIRLIERIAASMEKASGASLITHNAKKLLEGPSNKPPSNDKNDAEDDIPF